jgi:hypothetical protein
MQLKNKYMEKPSYYEVIVKDNKNKLDEEDSSKN